MCACTCTHVHTRAYTCACSQCRYKKNTKCTVLLCTRLSSFSGKIVLTSLALPSNLAALQSDEGDDCPQRGSRFRSSNYIFKFDHGRMARGGRGLPKVSCGPAMPYPSMPCGQAIPETAISGVARQQGRWPASVFYLFGHPTPYAYEFDLRIKTTWSTLKTAVTGTIKNEAGTKVRFVYIISFKYIWLVNTKDCFFFKRTIEIKLVG
jgi:hypothetical protein